MTIQNSMEWTYVIPENYKWGQAPAVCQVHGCDNDHASKGMCSAHKSRWIKAEKPDSIVFIVPIKPGKRAKDEPRVIMTLENRLAKQNELGIRSDKGGRQQTPVKSHRTAPGRGAPELKLKCIVPGCRVSRETRLLCEDHNLEWMDDQVGRFRDVWITSNGIRVDMRLRDPKPTSNKVPEEPPDPKEEKEEASGGYDAGPGYRSVNQLDFYTRRRLEEKKPN
jgi:hypothetical protein